MNWIITAIFAGMVWVLFDVYCWRGVPPGGGWLLGARRGLAAGVLIAVAVYGISQLSTDKPSATINKPIEEMTYEKAIHMTWEELQRSLTACELKREIIKMDMVWAWEHKDDPRTPAVLELNLKRQAWLREHPCEGTDAGQWTRVIEGVGQPEKP